MSINKKPFDRRTFVRGALAAAAVVPLRNCRRLTVTRAFIAGRMESWRRLGNRQ